jgi:hypothetical protein
MMQVTETILKVMVTADGTVHVITVIPTVTVTAVTATLEIFLLT